jgi:hypothetical protein
MHFRPVVAPQSLEGERFEPPVHILLAMRAGRTSMLNPATLTFCICMLELCVTTEISVRAGFRRPQHPSLALHANEMFRFSEQRRDAIRS